MKFHQRFHNWFDFHRLTIQFCEILIFEQEMIPNRFAELLLLNAKLFVFSEHDIYFIGISQLFSRAKNEREENNDDDDYVEQ